jgi:hypothetical protein
LTNFNEHLDEHCVCGNCGRMFTFKSDKDKHEKECVSLVEKIANRLSIILGGPHFSACACVGISCGNLGCSIWWEQVMKDDEIKTKIIDFYNRHEKEIANGIIKILSKRFLEI